MATTKLWHIKGRLRDLIEYVENPAKTVDPSMQDFFNVFSYAQKGVPGDLLPMLTMYYLAYRQDGEDWAILPVSAVDAWYGSTGFSKKWKKALPKDIVEYKESYGICKFRINCP